MKLTAKTLKGVVLGEMNVAGTCWRMVESGFINQDDLIVTITENAQVGGIVVLSIIDADGRTCTNQNLISVGENISSGTTINIKAGDYYMEISSS